MMRTNRPSAKDIKAAFKFSAFDKIIGEPTYSTLYKLETQATRNAATVSIRLPTPHNKLVGIVEQPAVYILRVGTPFPRPIYPVDSPIFPANSTTVQRATITNRYIIIMNNYNTYEATDNILKTMVENAIYHLFFEVIHSEILGFGNRTLQDIFLHLYQAYGRISPAALKNNTEKLTNPIAPDLLIALIFRKIEDCQSFVTARRAAFIQDQLIKAAETLVLQTGKYQLSYREWINLDPVEKTYNNFKTRLTNEYQVQNEMRGTTTRERGFANNIEQKMTTTSAPPLRVLHKPLWHIVQHFHS